MLVDEGAKPAVLAFVGLNLDFKLLSFFCELLSECLELEKLARSLVRTKIEINPRLTCCFQLSNSSTKKLFLLLTLVSSVSIRPLRLM